MILAVRKKLIRCVGSDSVLDFFITAVYRTARFGPLQDDIIQEERAGCSICDVSNAGNILVNTFLQDIYLNGWHLEIDNDRMITGRSVDAIRFIPWLGP